MKVSYKMPRGKDAKPRRRRGALEKCYGCPPEHPGWPRQVLRYRRKLPYCPECLPEHEVSPQPQCPNCERDFDHFTWNGSVEKTVVHCFCGFSGPAQDYYDDIDIKVLASPIEKI